MRDHAVRNALAFQRFYSAAPPSLPFQSPVANSLPRHFCSQQPTTPLIISFNSIKHSQPNTAAAQYNARLPYSSLPPPTANSQHSPPISPPPPRVHINPPNASNNRNKPQTPSPNQSPHLHHDTPASHPVFLRRGPRPPTAHFRNLRRPRVPLRARHLSIAAHPAQGVRAMVPLVPRIAAQAGASRARVSGSVLLEDELRGE